MGICRPLFHLMPILVVPKSTVFPLHNSLITLTALSSSATGRVLMPTLLTAVSPVPMASRALPLDISSIEQIAEAVTEGCLVTGFVTRGPSLILLVFRDHRARSV